MIREGEGRFNAFQIFNMKYTQFLYTSIYVYEQASLKIAQNLIIELVYINMQRIFFWRLIRFEMAIQYSLKLQDGLERPEKHQHYFILAS